MRSHRENPTYGIKTSCGGLSQLATPKTQPRNNLRHIELSALETGTVSFDPTPSFIRSSLVIALPRYSTVLRYDSTFVTTTVGTVLIAKAAGFIAK